MAIFVEIGEKKKKNCKLVLGHKRDQAVNEILRKNEGEGIMVPSFRLYYGIGIKKGNRLLEEQIQVYNTQFIMKEPKIFKKEKTISSTNSAGKTRESYAKEWN